MLQRMFPGALERADTGPLRSPLTRHPATRRTRWLWTVPLAAGFLTVFGWVAVHDPGPGLSLSDRGWLEVGLAGLLVLLLAVHRYDSTWRLVRMLAEYAAVALLAVLLVTATGMRQTPAPAAKHPAARAGTAANVAGDACPSVVQVRDWLACLWQAGQEAARRSHPPTTTPRNSR